MYTQYYNSIYSNGSSDAVKKTCTFVYIHFNDACLTVPDSIL